MDLASKVKPIKNNVFVFPVPLNKELKTDSGIIIPESADDFHDKPRWGTVVAIGPEVKELSTGDHIMITEGTGISFNMINDFKKGEIEEFLFIREDHAIVIIG